MVLGRDTRIRRSWASDPPQDMVLGRVVIVVEHLTKYYGATRALDDVSFAVRPGEVTALLGPNGSGKSTMMRVITGYFSPTAGRVRVGDVDVSERPAVARRRIGYLPEQV